MTYAAAAACLCLSAACSSPKGGKVEMTDLDGYRWEEPIEIAVDNDDTLTRRDLSLVVRYDRRLAVDTLVVHIATHTPDSLSLVERLTLHIPPRPYTPSSAYSPTAAAPCCCIGASIILP